MNISNRIPTSDINQRIIELTEKIRLVPRRISGRGIEGDWPIRLRGLYRERGFLYEKSGHLDDSINDYTEVINTFITGRSDSWSELLCDYFNRARVFHQKGDLLSVIKDYTKMIELYPEYHLAISKTWVSAYYKLRAEIYRELGDNKNADSDLAVALRLDPKGQLEVSEKGTIRIARKP